MQFQFTEVSNIQQQIEALTAQLQSLTASVAPYAECEAVASELVAKVAEHRQLMDSKGLAQNSLNSWAIALHEAGCGRKLEINLVNDLEIARLTAIAADYSKLEKDYEALRQVRVETDIERSNLMVQLNDLKKNVETEEIESLKQQLGAANDAIAGWQQKNDRLIAQLEQIEENAEGTVYLNLLKDYEELKKKHDFFVVSMREQDDLSNEVLKLRKENENYLQRYEGIKAQKDQVDGDFYAVRADRDRLAQALKSRGDSDQIAHLEEMLAAAKRQLGERDEEIGILEEKFETVVEELEEERQLNADEKLQRALVAEAERDELKAAVQILAARNKVLEASVNGADVEVVLPADSPSPDIEVEKNPTLELTNARILQINDVVQIPTGGCGSVVRFEGSKIVVNTVLGDVEYDRKDLAWVSSYTLPVDPAIVEEPTEEGNKYQNFLAKICKSSTAWNRLTWIDISKLFGKDKEGFKEIGLTGQTKAQREKRDTLFSSRFAQLLTEHIQTTGDRTELEWIPPTLRATVEILLEKQQSAGIAKGTEVQVNGEELVWTVEKHDTDTDWIDIINPLTKKKNQVHVSEISLVEVVAA